MKINILFICRYNRFRSKVAASYFRKINKNKNINVKSAGIIEGCPINENQIRLTKEFDINIKGSPRGLSSEILKWQDIIIVVADNVPKDLFKLDKKYNKKIIFWNISDVISGNNEEIKSVIEKVIKRVDKLNENLKNENANS